MARRVFIIVLDSFGIGELPDAHAFGDRDCNTLRRICASPRFCADNLIRMGIGEIDGVDLPGGEHPCAAVARMKERSRGKDTTIGHWEIAGVVSDRPLPTYPNGFPREVIDAFSAATGRGVLCNRPYSGTDVIRDFGKQHVETGDLIVYTSADSVFQIAAHEDVVPVETLYDYCRTARRILCGDHAVGRVIARPFAGEHPNYKRTADRHDFSLKPPKKTLLDAICAAGMEVFAIGKIFDIFAGEGITDKVFTHSNAEGMMRASEALAREFSGLCFVNLVDFDMLYGHRQDVDGYAAAIADFDAWLPSFVGQMREEDLLIITADHGCDPGDAHTDHTREYTPMLCYGKKVKPVDLHTRDSFADIAATCAEYLGVRLCTEGKSFWGEIEKQ